MKTRKFAQHWKPFTWSQSGVQKGRDNEVQEVEFGTEITFSSHRVHFLLSLVAWVMKTQRKQSHSKCLILNVFGCLLLPHVSESSLYICLITRLGPALHSHTETQSTTQAHLSVIPAADLHTAEQSSGTGWSSLEAAVICANTWYFQGAATAPGSQRYQTAFRLTLIMTFALRWQQETSLCLWHHSGNSSTWSPAAS